MKPFDKIINLKKQKVNFRVENLFNVEYNKSIRCAKKALAKDVMGEKNMVNVNKVVKETLHACGTWNGDVLQSFDWEALSEVAKALNNYLKAHKEQVKETAKKEKEEKKAKLAVGGKAYYNSLGVGAEFSYKSADGVIHKARKIETKSDSGLRAACELLECETKSAKRYPAFDQVIVPVQSVQVA